MDPNSSGRPIASNSAVKKRKATNDEPQMARKKRRSSKVMRTKSLPEDLQAIYDANGKSAILRILPPELRNRIYILVLGGQAVIERNQRGCIVRGPAYEDVEGARQIKSDAQRGIVSTQKGRFYRDKQNTSATEGLSLDFLQPCRQIHHEAALLPFSANLFVFESLTGLCKLLRGMVSEQASAVTSIIVTEGHGFGESIVTLRNLVQSRLIGLKQLVWIMNGTQAILIEDMREGEAANLRCFTGLPLKQVQVITSFPDRGKGSRGKVYIAPPPSVQSVEWQVQVTWQEDMERRLLGQKHAVNESDE